MNKYQVLTDEQVQNFINKGYLIVHDSLERDIATSWIDQAYARLGYDKNDPNTWTKDIIWMDHQNHMLVKEVAPKAWQAILDVVGGEDRLETQVMRIPESGHFSTINSFEWSDAFIVNFHRGAEQPWQPPSSQVTGWHKDGSYFRHFIDSREQALLTVVLWSDMLHQGGGTFIAPDSVRVVARYLYEHPEGVPAHNIDSLWLINQCHEFVELTGKAGDFVILHPYMSHASSQNVIRVPRFMTNPPIMLKEPMNLNRSDPADFSLLERATLHYLGLERCDFVPTHPRDSILVPA